MAFIWIFLFGNGNFHRLVDLGLKEIENEKL